MNTQEFRKFFAEQSGNYRLVDPNTFSDRGLGVFLNQALKFLDERQETKKSKQSYIKSVSAGESLITFTGCRYIEEVWITNSSTKAGYQMTPRTRNWMRTEYGTNISLLDSSAPVDWCNVRGGLSPDQYYKEASDLATVYDKDDVLYHTLDDGAITETHYSKQAILILPPPDQTYTVRIIGEFRSAPMTADTDISYWSEMNPLALFQATQLMLEMTFRNSEGMKDAINAIDLLLSGEHLDMFAEIGAEFGNSDGALIMGDQF